MTTPRRPRGSVVVRLAVAMLAAGVLFGALGTYLIVTREGDALRRDVHARHVLAADEFAVRVDGRVSAAMDALDLLATGDEVSSLDALASVELGAALRASPVFDELILLDSSGRPVAVAAARFAADPAEYPTRAAVATRVTQAPFVGVIHSFPPTVEVAVPVEDPPGNVVGALLGTTPLEVLASGVIRQPAGRDDPVRFIADEDGVILAHPNRDRVLRRERFPVTSLLAANPPAAEIDWRGEAHLAAAARTAVFPGTVVVKHRSVDALALANNRVRDVVEVLLMVLAASLLAIIAAGGWLLRPLRPLAHAVRRIGRGERGVRAPEIGRGEIAVVASEFNRMAAALDRRNTQVAELQHLSLLLTSQAERSELLGEITEGARQLFRADLCSFQPAGDNRSVVEAFAPDDTPDDTLRDAVAEVASRAGRRGTVRDGRLLGVAVTTVDGATLGTLVLSRPSGFEDEDVQLATALANVVAAALENVQRLELQRALAEELQRAVDQRRDLMGTVSHEFRTPLTCIEGFSSALLARWDDAPDDERRDLVSRINHHAQELEDLVSRLLDFAVTERGSLNAAVTDVDLAVVVPSVIDDLTPVVAGREVSVDVDDTRARADPVLLRRTLANLVSNAVKYSPAGSPIRVTATRGAGTVRVEVTDVGIGMSAEEAEQAFRPFWRAGNANTRSARGTGLGLALVAEYVRAMGGTCGVSSVAGKGSTFFFTLPSPSGHRPGEAVHSVYGGQSADADADRR